MNLALGILTKDLTLALGIFTLYQGFNLSPGDLYQGFELKDLTLAQEPSTQDSNLVSGSGAVVYSDYQPSRVCAVARSSAHPVASESCCVILCVLISFLLNLCLRDPTLI